MPRNESVKYFIITAFLLFFFAEIKSQNLFANPGFEDINNCTEYHADCATEAWFNIPAGNFLVNSHAPRPVLGRMVLVLPIGSVLSNFNKPRFVYTLLCCPLIRAQKYKLSFFINTVGLKFGQLAFYFTEKEPTLDTVNTLISTPSIVITEQNFDDNYKSGWEHVSCEYVATGDEKFCIITNAGLPGAKYGMKDAMNKSGDVFYFIDEILMQPESSVPLCNGYQDNIKKIYAQNYRHTDNIKILPEVPDMKSVPEFKNDTITISALFFDIGKSVLKPGVKNILDSVIVKLKEKDFLKVEINGHTDNTGNEKNNQILSEARASAIQHYLAGKLPEFTDRMTSIGKGQNLPVASNDTETGRQKNRRVEIIISYLNILK